MTPFREAEEIINSHGGNFAEDLIALLENGFVFSSPEYFLAGFPCRCDSFDLRTEFRDLRSIIEAERGQNCDAWFVWIAVGDLRVLPNLIPYPLPWIGFHRAGRMRTETRWIPARRFTKEN